jgi:hypothetical protein
LNADTSSVAVIDTPPLHLTDSRSPVVAATAAAVEMGGGTVLETETETETVAEAGTVLEAAG